MQYKKIIITEVMIVSWRFSYSSEQISSLSSGLKSKHPARLLIYFFNIHLYLLRSSLQFTINHKGYFNYCNWVSVILDKFQLKMKSSVLEMTMTGSNYCLHVIFFNLLLKDALTARKQVMLINKVVFLAFER